MLMVLLFTVALATATAAPIAAPTCAPGATGTFCVGPAVPVFGLNHIILTCPSGNSSPCPPGHVCGTDEGPLNKAACLAVAVAAVAPLAPATKKKCTSKCNGECLAAYKGRAIAAASCDAGCSIDKRQWGDGSPDDAEEVG